MSKLAIAGGTPVRMKPFTPWPQFDESERQGLLKVLESRNWGGYPFPNRCAKQFAERFAEHHDARHALSAGAIPVFVDVSPDAYCLDVEGARAAITAKTRAIIPVHLAMNMADMDALSALARQHGLKLIEDCAHAHGAKWRNRGAGSWGDAGSFSMQTSKLM